VLVVTGTKNILLSKIFRFGEEDVAMSEKRKKVLVVETVYFFVV